jgi:transaldolase
MGKLVELFEAEGQSPWLDNIKRGWITSGELARWVERGVRGLTSNPSIFQNAIEKSDDYDEQVADLTASGATVLDTYWGLVIADIRSALDILAPVHHDSDGHDGYVSIEVDPGIARDTDATIAAARHLHETIAAPNLYVKVPGTAEGLPAIRQMISEGRSINVTLLFSVERYNEVIDAYLDGLDACTGDLSKVSSVASFFVSRLDSECDQRLEAIGTPEALAVRGRAAVANAQLAYELFLDRFSGPRWDALAARGARVQRPLWASTSTKNPDYLETLYVDTLIGPSTVNTMPEATLEAFDVRGVVSRTVDADFDEARAVITGLAEHGIDLAEVTQLLEDDGVAKFSKAFDELLEALSGKADVLRG